jgi:adenylate cyclase class 1
VQQRLLPSPVGMGFFMNIKAIAELEEGVMSFTIFCNEQEFSALVYGDGLFKVVAQYIVAHRPSGEFYPCYITDLDLSLCHESLAQQTGLQLSHYLHIKAELEQELNRALKALH